MKKKFSILYTSICNLEQQIQKKKIGKSIQVVAGGSFRGESVCNGVRALPKKNKIILIHDAARPLVDKPIVKRVEDAARRYGAALAAWLCEFLIACDSSRIA